MGDTLYANNYKNVNFRKHPEKYVIGRGEQGVLIAEPYKSEILPHWKFATPDSARTSAQAIYEMFIEYKKQKDFVGMDMSRKFLQMGFTRSRRYANHSSGKKYDSSGNVKPQEESWNESPKAESARIFYKYYLKAREDIMYKKMKLLHQANQLKE
jgi:uncharacterized protein DUF4385